MSRTRRFAVVAGIGVGAAVFGARPGAAAAGAGITTPPAAMSVVGVTTVGPPALGLPMTSNGGPVQGSPAVYIVYWGWNGSDPSGQAAYQEAFFNGVGGSAWNSSQTQYCGGATNLVSTDSRSSEFPRGVSAVSSCPSGATYVGNPSGMLKGTWTDNANAVPANPTDADVRAEAVRAAAFFGNTTAASNQSTQYVIDTPSGNSTAGFGVTWCAYHDAVQGTSYGDITYTNFPYITDAGTACGQNIVNPGTAGLLDGVSIVAGHEFAETETDPLPSSGWADLRGQETGDKCAWIESGSSRMHDITLSTGTFAVQTLWSNAALEGAGSCVG